MQFQVPQFIEAEDKIVGPLTLRQFFIVGGAMLAIFILYYMVATWLWFFLGAAITGITFAFAFLKINGRSFLKVVQSAVSFYWRPQTYVWKSTRPPRAAAPMEAREGQSLEGIIAGIALKDTWRNLQTGTKSSQKEIKERYEIFQRLSGERQAARRIDYR